MDIKKVQKVFSRLKLKQHLRIKLFFQFCVIKKLNLLEMNQYQLQISQVEYQNGRAIAPSQKDLQQLIFIFIAFVIMKYLFLYSIYPYIFISSFLGFITFFIGYNIFKQFMRITNIIFISILAFQVFVLTVNQACTSDDEQFLVTFHPHLDAFWLNIDNQLKDINFRPAGFLYNMNQRNSKTIFNSMLEALSADSKRKYFVTESVFFKDWYDYINDDQKKKVKKLLQTGQLEIANGGWVENDEAVCYYDDILDQYTLGMNFLQQNLDYQVKIGWATDSFGHSHSQAALQHLLGIQFQGIQRVDDRYVNLHNDKPLLQFYWSPVSDSNNLTYGGVLNHVRHFLHQVNNYRNARADMIKSDFIELEKNMLKMYGKNKLFRFLGNDFEEFISEEFSNLQNAMDGINTQRGKTSCPTFKYGNPTDYLGIISKYYQTSELKVRKWDFIPNWDQDRYWTGYYTTDPQLKKACKDYSRLINFYRKSLLQMDRVSDSIGTLIGAEELLAVMQHHDGITATSKTYIEDQFRNRMSKRSSQIIGSLSKLHGADTNSILCKFYQNNNECEITEEQLSGHELKLLNIITHGSSKKEKIEIKLPKNSIYDIQEADEDLFCQADKCTLIFQALLHPGINTFTLISKTKDQFTNQIFEMQKQSSLSYSGRDFSIIIDSEKKNEVRYEYGDGEFYTIGLYTSPNQGSSRQTMSWDKFGRRTDKTEHVMAGMYIMSNNGQITPIYSQFTSLKVAQGKVFKRIIAISSNSELRITIKNDEPNVMDILHIFKPQQQMMMDYFMKISSTVKSDTLFHDSNGFLVAKRLFNQRPDYQFKPKPEDAINANTYPACSFAYLINQDKKLLFFTDRAQGVSTFDKDLLINFDRLAMDDGKGVGESYFKSVNNTFRYKVALVSVNDDLERTWQREYDDALIGYMIINDQENSLQYRANSADQISHQPGLGTQVRLKYSIFHLNKDEFVLRLQNLAQFSQLQLNKYQNQQGSYSWEIVEVGLKLVFKDIKDSYANGIIRENPQKWRKHWSKDKEEINLINQNIEDESKITLRPLEIRSFRINKKQTITVKEVESRQANPILGQLTGAHVLKSSGFRKRCF